jgi:hypothetical protein
MINIQFLSVKNISYILFNSKISLIKYQAKYDTFRKNINKDYL